MELDDHESREKSEAELQQRISYLTENLRREKNEKAEPQSSQGSKQKEKPLREKGDAGSRQNAGKGARTGRQKCRYPQKR